MPHTTRNVILVHLRISILEFQGYPFSHNTNKVHGINKSLSFGLKKIANFNCNHSVSPLKEKYFFHNCLIEKYFEFSIICHVFVNITIILSELYDDSRSLFLP